MEGTKLLLKDAIKGLSKHIDYPGDNIDIYIAMATHHISQVKLWGDTWLEKLDAYKRTVEQLKATNNNTDTYTVLVSEVPVTFRVNVDGAIELIGIPDEDSREVAAVRAECLAYLDEMKEFAAEDIGMFKNSNYPG